MDSIEWVLTYIRSTKGTHVYGDGNGHTVYVPKAEVSGNAPASIKLTITWKV
jgi:hypothetical protein